MQGWNYGKSKDSNSNFIYDFDAYGSLIGVHAEIGFNFTEFIAGVIRLWD